MKHIDLYSGLGGFALACDWLGIESILHCEIDTYCQALVTIRSTPSARVPNAPELAGARYE